MHHKEISRNLQSKAISSSLVTNSGDNFVISSLSFVSSRRQNLWRIQQWKWPKYLKINSNCFTTFPPTAALKVCRKKSSAGWMIGRSGLHRNSALIKLGDLLRLWCQIGFEGNKRIVNTEVPHAAWQTDVCSQSFLEDVMIKCNVDKKAATCVIMRWQIVHSF